MTKRGQKFGLKMGNFLH